MTRYLQHKPCSQSPGPFLSFLHGAVCVSHLFKLGREAKLFAPVGKHCNQLLNEQVQQTVSNSLTDRSTNQPSRTLEFRQKLSKLTR